MALRGNLPRSFRVNPADPLYGQPIQTAAYSYDSSLAIIATAIRRQLLAHEIVNGTLLSQIGVGEIPFTAEHMTAAPIGTYIQNNAVAMTAYALGYFLETNPSSPDYCMVAELLRDVLNYLQAQREWVYSSGLIIDGRDTSGIATEDYDYITTDDEFNVLVTEDSLASSIRTEDNLLAFYAFKQAGKVFAEPFYTATSDELKTAILNRLWANDRLYYGLTTTGIPITTNVLYVHAYGALFMNEIHDNPKALLCLNKCEVFACLDSVNGATGFKTFMGPENIVNFEMSYAVALGYHRQNNFTRYYQIINELNRFVDVTDGGFKGSLIKRYLNEDMISYKAVGSTAWSIITNILESSAFRIRSSVTAVISCSVPYFNTVQSQTFTRIGCAVGTTPTSYTYVVPAGRYISWVSVGDANDLALDEIATFGQAYVNANGSCIPIASVGNEEYTGYYYTDACLIGYIPVPYPYTVPANTFYSTTLPLANAMAEAYADVQGQNEAYTFGVCSPVNPNVNIYMTLRVVYTSGTYFIYERAFSSVPVNANIRVYSIIGAETGATNIPPFVVIPAGDTMSNERVGWIYDNIDYSLTFGITVTNVAPNPSNGITYTY